MDESKPCIELGFIEKVDLWKLKSKYFPNKVGGFPSWLSLESLPLERELACEKCQKPTIFLCQVYAPVTSNEECFHRTIFLFICRNGECSLENDSSNLKVFRCQLPRQNKYYSFDPPKEDETECDNPSASNYGKLCRVCGASGPKLCGGCKLASYCSREHQAVDWKAEHKANCKSDGGLAKVSLACHEILFPEFEIDLEPEELPSENESDDDAVEKYEEILKRGQPESADDGEYKIDDLIEMAARETDKQFAKFRSRISNYPDQILRYDINGEPLYVASENKPSDVPACEYCGEKRQFEFQIMPQLLSHLKVDSFGQSIDWGTIMVYTCSKNCSPESVSYVSEVVYKQDYRPSTDFLKQ